jgi:hypothetical protein
VQRDRPSTTDIIASKDVNYWQSLFSPSGNALLDDDDVVDDVVVDDVVVDDADDCGEGRRVVVPE